MLFSKIFGASPGDAADGSPELLSNRLDRLFHEWASTCPKYSPLYKKTPASAFEITSAAFHEIYAVKPGVFYDWWAKEHNRFIHSHKQRDIMLIHELMYVYLTKCARGEL